MRWMLTRRPRASSTGAAPTTGRRSSRRCAGVEVGFEHGARLRVERRRAHLGALVADHRQHLGERAAGVGHVVDEQHALAAERGRVEHRREQHRLGQALVDARVELHVDRAARLGAERVRDRAGEQQSAAGDRDHHVGGEPRAQHVAGERSRAASPNSSQVRISRRIPSTPVPASFASKVIRTGYPAAPAGLAAGWDVGGAPRVAARAWPTIGLLAGRERRRREPIAGVPEPRDALVEVGDDRRRRRAHDRDPARHEQHRVEPARRGHRVQVPVADRRDRDDRPPQESPNVTMFAPARRVRPERRQREEEHPGARVGEGQDDELRPHRARRVALQERQVLEEPDDAEGPEHGQDRREHLEG